MVQAGRLPKSGDYTSARSKKSSASSSVIVVTEPAPFEAKVKKATIRSAKASPGKA